ncbi:MAG: hypothetical protein KAS32_22720 [Candidatus Peribacteraceae bacterium]|nr:hypothetical protein [Candidatus Peribacteraceae bacterium]
MNKLCGILGKLEITMFEASGNDNSVWIIEQWAQESLMVLEANMIAANMVFREYDSMIAQHGETVNARIPGSFLMKRKTDDDAVTKQAATTTSIPVVLNQHLHVSFIIKDGEESKSFNKLRDEYVEPAVKAISQGVDEIVLSQVYQFLANSVGYLGTSPTDDTMVDAGTIMDVNKVPTTGRKMILTPQTKGSMLKIDDVKHADKRGDGGFAMKEGEVGRISGFDTFMSQNCPYVAAASQDVVTGAVNAGNLTVGSTVITVDGLSAAIVAGTFCTIVGDMRPRRILSSVGGATPTSITLETAIETAILDDAVVTLYDPGLINEGDDYAIGYAKDMVIDGYTLPLSVGSMVTLGGTAGTLPHGVLSGVTTVLMTLDRPIEVAAADDSAVCGGPVGNYNFGFIREAIALVTRPLAAPAAGAGALSYVAEFNDLAIRVTITYDGSLQGHLVTIDMLCGIKTLNTNMGVVMLG